MEKNYNYLLKVEYDGTGYSGWQCQKNSKSIQERIEKTLSKILKFKIKIIGAGRTDKGVHAFGQYANFKIDHKIENKKKNMKYLLFDTLVIDKKYRGMRLSDLLMSFNNTIIKLSGFSSFLIFLSLGIGFALPYILLSIFPSMLSLLPRPGTWMETFKQFMAFPMILTALWLVWVLSSQIDSFQLVLVLLGISLIVFFYWLNQLKISSKIGLQFRNVIYLAVLVSLFFTLPIQKASLQQDNNIFSDEELAKRLAKGPVFLNFTADWCITCKVNERVALKTEETLKFFEKRNIFYLEADWTNKNELIAKKLASFGRSSIPLYIYYPDEKSVPIILPEILTESVIKDYLN